MLLRLLAVMLGLLVVVLDLLPMIGRLGLMVLGLRVVMRGLSQVVGRRLWPPVLAVMRRLLQMVGRLLVMIEGLMVVMAAVVMVVRRMVMMVVAAVMMVNRLLQVLGGLLLRHGGATDEHSAGGQRGRNREGGKGLPDHFSNSPKSSSQFFCATVVVTKGMKPRRRGFTMTTQCLRLESERILLWRQYFDIGEPPRLCRNLQLGRNRAWKAAAGAWLAAILAANHLRRQAGGLVSSPPGA